jgi:hypothetical protein
MPTLYDLTIPAYAGALRALSGQLVKALDWGEQNGVGELQFVAARLAPDMFPLAAQVRFTCAQAIQTAARLGADNVPDLREDAPDFQGLQTQIAATLAWLDTIASATLDGDDDRAVSFDLPNGMTFDMTAATYVRDWAQPQFYFHLVAAYAVMRHMGVPLGKGDYVSYMMPYLRPGTAPTA